MSHAFSHHHAGPALDPGLEGRDRGMWALKISLAGLGVTAGFQLAVVVISGSVGLFADTVHNLADALTAVPLGIAFFLGRRPPTRRYTYGYGRAEDLAGVAIVITVLASALVVAYESAQRLVTPRPLEHIGWVIAAAVVGFLGNEGVAVFRIRVGKEIGSAALVADGQHARADGVTSLAVLVGAILVLAGFPRADPIVGLVISAAILLIVRSTAVLMWHRLMDAVDPEMSQRIEQVAASIDGVEGVSDVRVRWIGHRLHVEVNVVVDEDLPTSASHRIAEEVRHQLVHAEPHLATVRVHVDPCGHGGNDPHDKAHSEAIPAS